MRTVTIFAVNLEETCYYLLWEKKSITNSFIQKNVQEKAEATAKTASPAEVKGEGVSNGGADPELETLRCQLQDLQLVLHKKDEQMYQMQQQKNIPNGDTADSQSKEVCARSTCNIFIKTMNFLGILTTRPNERAI